MYMEQQCMLGHGALLQHLISPKLHLTLSDCCFWSIFSIMSLISTWGLRFSIKLELNSQRLPTWILSKFCWVFYFEVKHVKHHVHSSHAQIHSLLLREKVFQKVFELVLAVISDQEGVAVVCSSDHGWQTWNTETGRADGCWTDLRPAASGFLTSPRWRPEQAQNFLLHVHGSSQFIADPKRRLRYLGNHNWAQGFKGQRSPMPS